MKRIVAKCSVSDIFVILPVFEAFAIPPQGANVIVACPACHARHQMQARDMRRRDKQQAA